MGRNGFLHLSFVPLTHSFILHLLSAYCVPGSKPDSLGCFLIGLPEMPPREAFLFPSYRWGAWGLPVRWSSCLDAQCQRPVCNSGLTSVLLVPSSRCYLHLRKKSWGPIRFRVTGRVSGIPEKSSDLPLSSTPESPFCPNDIHLFPLRRHPRPKPPYSNIPHSITFAEFPFSHSSYTVLLHVCFITSALSDRYVYFSFLKLDPKLLNHTQNGSYHLPITVPSTWYIYLTVISYLLLCNRLSPNWAP